MLAKLPAGEAPLAALRSRSAKYIADQRSESFDGQLRIPATWSAMLDSYDSRCTRSCKGGVDISKCDEILDQLKPRLLGDVFRGSAEAQDERRVTDGWSAGSGLEHTS